ncbi:PREDICTED: uncharacterized protein LOC109216392 [Nicotiana attenuata]|uniref:Uncharacterized protein n=1 Tax=Nicotiana attenuata TaxID=49451 RepID=A0A1J6KYK7_NICAT|nr:PREDICTED: uncharacterized protein LOC109216392 [Nicotiana attenuata]OIT24129.1 hypothetical protein A4A49_27916 [Nicotiana attenuata]
MACWSAENATKAYLRAIKMGKRAKEPDMAEFISALAAGNNAQLMVVACADAAGSATALALVAAAQQTGGRVICIIQSADKLNPSIESLGDNVTHVEFVIGDALTLLMNDYREADFVLIDCNLNNCEGILQTARMIGENVSVLGYNALSMGSWRCQSFNAHLLPIGGGLLVTNRVAKKGGNLGVWGKKNRWIVKVDKCTGEEHVFRIRSSHAKPVEA